MANQKTVISWLEQIVPEIKSTRDPEGTMLKFARANNLAPAQLEKLAQVYNAAKTLSFLEKSANRGDKFHVVDAEDLVSKYASAESKQASPKRACDADDWFDKAAAISEHEAFPRPTVKSALHEEPVYSVAPDTARAKIREYLLEKDATRRNILVHEEVAFNARQDVIEKIAAVAESLRATPHLDFAAVERDALYVNAACKEACDLVARRLEKHISIKRASDSGKKRLINDSQGFVAAINEIQDMLGVAKAATELRDEFRKQATKTEFGSETKTENSTSEGLGSWEQQISGKKKQNKSEDIPRPAGQRDLNGRNVVADELVDLVKGISVPSFPGDPAGMVGALLSDAMSGRKNRGQEKVDRDYDELQTKTVLERLVFTDPIISQADPDMVASLAQSIRNRSPEIAGDINAMRAELRSALQYGSMPSMTVKELAGIQKTIDDDARIRSEAKRDRYAIPSSKLIG